MNETPHAKNNEATGYTNETRSRTHMLKKKI